MRLYIPILRSDPDRRAAEVQLREAAGGVPMAEGHTFEVGDNADLRAARDALNERLPVAWPLHGAALLD